MLMPVQDFVLVEIPSDDTGIVIPEGKENNQRAIVISFGKGIYDDAHKNRIFPVPELKEKDKVILQKFSINETFDLDGKKVALVKATDIMAIEGV
jgi:co-chaperonin GroES (HSP10)